VEFLPSLLYELIVKRFPMFINVKSSALRPSQQRELESMLPFQMKVADYTNKRAFIRQWEEYPFVKPLISLYSLEKLVSRLFFTVSKTARNREMKLQEISEFRRIRI